MRARRDVLSVHCNALFVSQGGSSALGISKASVLLLGTHLCPQNHQSTTFVLEWRSRGKSVYGRLIVKVLILRDSNSLNAVLRFTKYL